MQGAFVVLWIQCVGVGRACQDASIKQSKTSCIVQITPYLQVYGLVCKTKNEFLEHGKGMADQTFPMGIVVYECCSLLLLDPVFVVVHVKDAVAAAAAVLFGVVVVLSNGP